MRVLVLAASRHGATAEIADAIGVRLRGHGHVVDVGDPAEVHTSAGYGAVVIGSAVYAGSWLKVAREFVDRNTESLAAAKVWLFSSGPLDDPGMTTLSEAKLDALTAATGSLDHHVFAGRLERGALNRAERLLTKIVHAPDGDFRDWDDVTRWSEQIADALAEPSRPADPRAGDSHEAGAVT